MNDTIALGRPELDALTKYLARTGTLVVGELRASVITGGHSNLTVRIEDDKHDWVLRRPPIEGGTPNAHNVGREYRVMQALQQTAVPVAATVAHCSDPAILGAPFTIVEFVPGRAIRTQEDVNTLSDAEIDMAGAELVRVLVELHSLSFRDLGLDSFGRPDGFLNRQLQRWRQQWDDVAKQQLPDVERLFCALEAYPRVGGDATIVHGDYRIDNTLIDQTDAGRVRAVVDWELSTIGDPLTDIALMCAYQHTDFDYILGAPAASTSDRWPTVDVLAQEYATRSGRNLDNFAYYLGLAYFKLAAIAEGISSRFRAGGGAGPGYASASEAVPRLLAEGLSVVGTRR